MTAQPEFIPMSMPGAEALGIDTFDIIFVSVDAYIDHPSFGIALVGRLLEAQGYRVGIISQPDWHSADAFRALGQPTLFRRHSGRFAVYSLSLEDCVDLFDKTLLGFGQSLFKTIK